MGRSQFNQAKSIFDNRAEIIEKYNFFDSDRDDFVYGLNIEKANIAQFLFFLLDIVDKEIKRLSPKRIDSLDKISNRILTVIIEYEPSGISSAVLCNRLKSIDFEIVKDALNKLVESNDIIAKEVKPKRGPTTIKYFVPQL